MHKITALTACLLFACAAQAQDAHVRTAVEEAASVHSIATAARLCNLISDSDLTRATSRMDRVHAGQLDSSGQETYLLVRSGESFRNMVFASALKRAQGGCAGELAATWRDVESSLITADLNSGSTFAAR